MSGDRAIFLSVTVFFQKGLVSDLAKKEVLEGLADDIVSHFHGLQSAVRLNSDICDSVGLKEIGEEASCTRLDLLMTRSLSRLLDTGPPLAAPIQLIWCIKAVVKFLGMESVVSQIGQSEVEPPLLWLRATEEVPKNVPCMAESSFSLHSFIKV